MQTFGKPLSTPQSDRVDSPLDRKWFGAGTNIRERGELLTSPRIEAVDATTQVLDVNTNVLSTVFNLADGTSFSAHAGGVTTMFEHDFGFEVEQLVNGVEGVTIRDGNFFFLDDNLYQLDTGRVLTVESSGEFIRSLTEVIVGDSQGNFISFVLTNLDAVASTPTQVPRDLLD